MNSLFKQALLSEDTRFYQEIKAPSMEEQEVRLNVYRNNVVVSLVDALCDIFPVTQASVGDEFFRAMARVYLLDSPPKTPVIGEYGDGFPDFIRLFDPVKSLPFLSDLAALELSMLALTNSEEYTTLSHDEVSSAFAKVEDPSVLRLHLPPTTQILVSSFSIGSLYHAHASDGAQRLREIDIDQKEYLLLVKSHLYAQLHVIQHDEAVFIKNLMQQKTLEASIPDVDSFDVGQMLAKLIEWQVLINVTQ